MATCRHCDAEGRGNLRLHALAQVTAFQHGSPRRCAPCDDGLMRTVLSSRTALHALHPVRHRGHHFGGGAHHAAYKTGQLRRSGDTGLAGMADFVIAHLGDDGA